MTTIKEIAMNTVSLYKRLKKESKKQLTIYCRETYRHQFKEVQVGEKIATFGHLPNVYVDVSTLPSEMIKGIIDSAQMEYGGGRLLVFYGNIGYDGKVPSVNLEYIYRVNCR
jgi:hypothetical protein